VYRVIKIDAQWHNVCSFGCADVPNEFVLSVAMDR